MSAVVSVGLTATPARAHPHIFFDAHAEFLINEKGLLEAVRVVYQVDDYTSLYTLTELGLDADGDGALTRDEERELTQSVNRGLSDYGYYVDLREVSHDEPIGLGSATAGAAMVENGLVIGSYDVPLIEPLDVSKFDFRLRLYDPSYYTAITMADAPKISGPAPEGCKVTFEKFNPDALMAELQSQLALLSREETPEDQDIGAKFADETVLECD